MKANEHAEKIDQHIRFIEQIIQKPTISVLVRHELSQQISKVRERRDDANLYLAIIGEFSSGKSTFINALLRDNLLKTSALVATATATRINYASSFSAEALFKNARPKQFIYKRVEEESGKQTLKKQIAWIPSLVIWMPLMIWLSSISSWFLGLLLFPIVIVTITAISQQLKQSSTNARIRISPPPPRLVTSKDAHEMGISPKQFVQMVTSDEELARTLENFKIYHPADFLKSRIVIIDTPGTNASNAEHGKATQTVVENEADAAVIIIPANQPVSDTLINFLSGALYQYIHRCVFVVTKMDGIRSKEQLRLLETIQKRLKEKLKIEQLFLIEAAPQVVIDAFTGEEEVEEGLKYWNDKFLELEEKLREYLVSSREAAIAESLGRLLSHVFRQFESHLKEQQEIFRCNQEAIEREVIRDLPSFTFEQHAECSRMIENSTSQAKHKATKLVNNCREKTELNLRSNIFNAKNKDELKTVLEKQVSSVFREAHSTLNRELSTAVGELNYSFTQVKGHFDKKFSQQYRNLQALSTKANLDAGKETQGNLQISTSNVMTVVSELSKTAGDEASTHIGAGAGVGAGVIIGTALLPGVGTVVGAALGSLLGGILGSLFGPSLSELQNRSWTELQPKIRDYFQTAEKSVEQSLENYAKQMTDTLNKHIDVYIETYQKIVNAMQQEQKEEKERLIQLQKEIQTDLLEINTRIQSIEMPGTSA